MGILKKIRKSRTAAKAEIKAAKVRARQEVKEGAALQLKREKLLSKAEKNLLKEEKKGLKAKRKHDRKMAENTLEQMKQGRVNSKNMARWTGVARLALPMLIPVFYRAITSAREQLVSAKASRVGVSPEQLAQYSGHGAELKARIHGVRQTVEQGNHPTGFTLDVKDRLDTLTTAVDNAEFMTSDQRRRAHSSISNDLGSITQEIQDRIRTQG